MEKAPQPICDAHIVQKKKKLPVVDTRELAA
jgi:hypothetical protein